MSRPILSLLALLSLPPLHGLAAAEPPATPADAGLAQAIAGLGSATHRDREAAQARLLALADPHHEAVLEACLRAAATSDDAEVQARLEEVMMEVVDRKILNAPRGFLGIRLMRDTLLLDGKETPAILASEVLPDTGAAKAGVLSGDYIIACDGKPVPEDPTTLAFIQYVQSHPPGKTLRLAVVREARRMTIDVVLGDRPPEARGFSTRPVQPLEDFFHEWRVKECQRLGLPVP